MLGPSGSGKTTTLRMIAGFELPDAGTIELGGRDVGDLPPYDREVNTVFQDYALFPHMTVGENVEYGMRVRKVAKDERAKRRDEALEMVRLTGYGGPQAGRALGRPAPARRPRALDRQPAARPAPRRAARGARPEAARADAGRAQADPGRRRDHLRLRHARPGGGADDVRPDRGLQRGPDRAGRRARRGLRAPGESASSPASSASRTCSSATARTFTDRARRRSACSRPASPTDGLQTERGRVRRRRLRRDDHPLPGRPRRRRGASSRPPEPGDVLGRGARPGRAGGGRRMAAGAHGRGLDRDHGEETQ